MPKTTNPPGRHREQRLKMLAAKPQWLANDAPYGEYLVDTVALELFLRGAALSTYGEDEFVRRLHWWPGKLLLTRLFEDIQHIRSRIRRIEGLDRSPAVVNARPRRCNPRFPRILPTP